MELAIKNIGKIKETCIEINGISVIAGENNTGKSTVSKALYFVFNGFYDIENRIHYEKSRSINNLIRFTLSDMTSLNRLKLGEVSKKIISKLDFYRNDKESLENDITTFFPELDFDDEHFNILINRLEDILSVSDEEIFKNILNKKLQSEFNGQINNIFDNQLGEIVLNIKNGQKMKITVEGNKVIDIQNDMQMRTEAVYLDDPFVLDDVSAFSNFLMFDKGVNGNHKEYLRYILSTKGANSANVIDEIVTAKKIESVYDKINSICSGDIVSENKTLGYRKENTDEILDVRNISTGLKTFLILKMLLMNGTIQYNGTIILDEPEIHLHPQWQLLFAELIVLLQKEFNMHILVNTHSPYFLNAIEVYAKKHGIVDCCKYYLASISEDSHAVFEDVSNNIEKIYQKLARAFQILENELYED